MNMITILFVVSWTIMLSIAAFGLVLVITDEIRWKKIRRKPRRFMGK